MGTVLGPKYIPYSYMEPLGSGFLSGNGMIPPDLKSSNTGSRVRNRCSWRSGNHGSGLRI